MDIVSTDVSNIKSTIVLTKFECKKIRYKIVCHILHTILLVIMSLLIITIIYYYYAKDRTNKCRANKLRMINI